MKDLADGSSVAEDAHLQAAALAFAMLRFEQGAAHRSLSAIVAGLPRIGVDCFVFAPLPTHLPISAVPAYLADLPCPALLIPTTTQGVVSLMLLDELSGERRAAAERISQLQISGLERQVEALGLTAASQVLLSFDDEEYIVSVSVLRIRCRRFPIAMSSLLEPSPDDARVAARLVLLRSDGLMSRSGPCPAA